MKSKYDNKSVLQEMGGLLSGNKVVCLLGGNKTLFTTKYKIGYS